MVNGERYSSALIRTTEFVLTPKGREPRAYRGSLIVRDAKGAMTLIGAAMTGLAPGYCAIAIQRHPEILQQHGYVHAGIVATLVDSAGGFAGFTLFPAESSVLTVEFKLNLLAPATGDRLVAEGFVVKPGRTLVITRGEV